MAKFEKNDADHSVIKEKPADLEGMNVLPVTHGREIGNGQVIDIERFVVSLILREIEIGIF